MCYIDPGKSLGVYIFRGCSNSKLAIYVARVKGFGMLFALPSEFGRGGYIPCTVAYCGLVFENKHCFGRIRFGIHEV